MHKLKISDVNKQTVSLCQISTKYYWFYETKTILTTWNLRTEIPQSTWLLKQF